MTLTEAHKYMGAGMKHHSGDTDETHCEIVRILPRDVDPVIDGDNGWDVKVVIDPNHFGGS